MASITSVAEAFFAACETGKGWDGCSAYCTPNATFCAQAEPLLEVKTLAQYTDWMKSLMSVLPDGRYEVKSFATDATRNNVAAYGVFHGTHTGVRLTPEADALARRYLAEGILSANMLADAQHIAMASIASVDALVSWNFRHVVNLPRIHQYHGVNVKLGYPAIEIRSPREVLTDE